MRARSSSTSPFTSSPCSANGENKAYSSSALSRSRADGLARRRGTAPSPPRCARRAARPGAPGRSTRRRPARGVQSRNSFSGVGAELVAHDRVGQARRHRRGVGLQHGQRRWRLRGSPSAMKPMSWPAFMMAPFMWPSSRATSSAVRMANCSSSSSLRPRWVVTPRVFIAAQRAPLRAVRRQTLALRVTCARCAGSRAIRLPANATVAAPAAAAAPAVDATRMVRRLTGAPFDRERGSAPVRPDEHQ